MPVDNTSRSTVSSGTDGQISHDASQSIDRRTCLRLAGAGLIAGLATGVSGVSATEDEYDVVLDVVEDLGADNTGTEPINDILTIVDEHDSLRLLFPEGEYLLENGPGGDGFARWDFGDGDEVGRVGKLALEGRGDVTLTPPDGGRHNILTIWGREVSIENFRIDQTAHDTSTGITAVAEENLSLRNLHFDGKVTGDYVEIAHPSDPAYDPGAVLPDPFCVIPGVLNEDGTGVVENVRAPDGVESHSRKGAAWVNLLHAGDLLFDNCEFSNFSDNAIYASAPGTGGAIHGDGRVRVENCHFENNNVTAIRLGTPGSYAKNCTVITEAGEIPATPWGAITSRAGWVWYGFDGTYENIDVVHDHPNGEGILEHPSNDGSLEVVNSRFELNRDGRHAVRYLQGGDTLRLNNVRVSGEAGVGSALNLGNCDVTINNFCLTQSGADRNGISLQNASGKVNNPSIDVSGEAIVMDEESTVTVRNLSKRRRCR
ncbi:right-handed parallel beta-helix repeat-containing protein [Natronosalvus amylolyticus]|uniref:right-handed parallel beta-helix repeat-containing protein n=1 Tax=Natronosalvus amylolyticus TaxID=2961994 RepID=UPI0020CA090B|nr:right-handed parallel beta-helix repeat-containing protein [Natronosalvus amylolyticus]